MIDLLEKNGYIISLNTSSNLIFYKITRNGIDAYEKWIKDFLEFARTTNITNVLDMASTTTNNESLKKDSDNSSNNVMMMTIL